MRVDGFVRTVQHLLEALRFRVCFVQFQFCLAPRVRLIAGDLCDRLVYFVHDELLVELGNRPLRCGNVFAVQRENVLGVEVVCHRIAVQFLLKKDE